MPNKSIMPTETACISNFIEGFIFYIRRIDHIVPSTKDYRSNIGKPGEFFSDPDSCQQTGPDRFWQTLLQVQPGKRFQL